MPVPITAKALNTTENLRYYKLLPLWVYSKCNLSPTTLFDAENWDSQYLYSAKYFSNEHKDFKIEDCEAKVWLRDMRYTQQIIKLELSPSLT